MLDVRDYRSDDLATIAGVAQAAFGSPLPPADISRIALAPHRLLVAAEKGTVVGFAASTHYDGAAYVGPVAVSPGRQNRGIGRALLAEVIARAERAGVTSFALEASEAGAHLYQKFGFRKSGETYLFERRIEPATFSASTAGADDAPEDSTALHAALQHDAAVYEYDRRTVLRNFVTNKPRATILLAETGFAFADATSYCAPRARPGALRAADSARARIAHAVVQFVPFRRQARAHRARAVTAHSTDRERSVVALLEIGVPRHNLFAMIEKNARPGATMSRRASTGRSRGSVRRRGRPLRVR